MLVPFVTSAPLICFFSISNRREGWILLFISGEFTAQNKPRDFAQYGTFMVPFNEGGNET